MLGCGLISICIYTDEKYNSNIIKDDADFDFGTVGACLRVVDILINF